MMTSFFRKTVPVLVGLNLWAMAPVALAQEAAPAVAPADPNAAPPADPNAVPADPNAAPTEPAQVDPNAQPSSQPAVDPNAVPPVAGEAVPAPAPSAEPAPAAPAPAAAPVGNEKGWGWLSVAGWASLAVGTIGLIIGAVTLANPQDFYAATSAQRLISPNSVFGFGSLVAGAALAVVGGVLLYLDTALN